MTLVNQINQRVVPGAGEGVLPNYAEYASGMWSWDTYKQAVGMALWAPELAKRQLRLLVRGRDYQAGLAHIPDKVDRCGRGGGCAGKPPLLSWAVWAVYNHTADTAFLGEMYPTIDSFHRCMGQRPFRLHRRSSRPHRRSLSA
jgi:putative isomerase